MPRLSGHRMRFYRRNFKRMFPDAGERARRQLQAQLRWRTWARVAAAGALVLAVLGLWWRLVLR